MSTPMLVDPIATAPARRRPPITRGAPIVVFVAEVLAITYRFDGGSLSGRYGSWLALLLGRHSHLLVSLAICCAALMAALLYDIGRDDTAPSRCGPDPGRGSGRWPYLLGHLAAYGGLVWITAWIFEGSAMSSPWVAGWLALWAAAAIVTFGLLMFTALSPAGWLRLARARWRMMLLAAAAGVTAWLVGRGAVGLWEALHGSTFQAVRGVLGLFYSDVVCKPEKFVLGTQRYRVRIWGECSGFQGIGLIWAFLAAYFWWARRDLRFPHALLLIPIGTALSWSFNVLRIAGLVALGDRGYEALAGGGFHSQAGSLAFSGLALGLIAMSRRVPMFRRADGATVDEPAAAADPTAAYIAPLVAVALTTMITGAVSEGGPDRLYAVRVVAALAVLRHFRRDYTELRGLCSSLAIALGVAAYAIWITLEPAATGAVTTTTNALAGLPGPLLTTWLAARAFGSVIVVPVVEELAFRGYLTRRLIAAGFHEVPAGRFTWPSFLASSLLFGLLHQDRWIAGTIAGMVYALAYYRRGKLIDAVAAHATTNLCVTIAALWTGDYARWS